MPVPLEWQPYTPANAIFSDEVQVLEPWRKFAVEEVRAGRLPLWNPWNYCGAPFLAANQSALFSPFRVLDYLFPGTLIIAWGQVAKSLGFNLANPLPGHPKQLTHLFEGTLTTIIQTKAQTQEIALTR